MSIAAEPNKGLRLKLGRLAPIPTWHGGGNFWSHEFQLTVRSGTLAAFLPRAVEEEDSVLYEYRSGGAELASTSTPVGSMSEIPAKQLDALRAAVDELKRKAEDPHCDRTKRRMIEAFRLPDPQKDSDLYRLVGKGSSAKLIVLWGVERDEGSALAPGAAVDLMHTPGSEESEEEAPAKKSLALPLVAALALLLGGGAWLYWQAQEKARIAAHEAALASQQAEEAARIAAFNAAAAGSAADDAAAPTEAPTTDPAAPEDRDAADPPADGSVAAADAAASSTPPALPGAPGGSADASKAGSAESPAAADGPAAAAKSSGESTKGPVGSEGAKKAESPPTAGATKGSEKASSPAGSSSSATGKSGTTGGAGSPGAPSAPSSSTAASDAAKSKATRTDSSSTAPTPAPGTVVRDRSGAVTGVVGRDGKMVPAAPGTVVGSDGKVTATTPGTIVRDRNGVVTGICGRDGRVIATTPGRIIDDPDGRLITGVPGTVVRNREGVVTGVYGSDGRLVSAAPGTVIDRTGRILTSRPGTVFRNSEGLVNGVVGADGRVVDATPGAVGEDPFAASRPTAPGAAPGTGGAPPASTTTPMTTEGAPPAGISSLSIVSTSLSPVLANGNVEVLFNVVARDEGGTVVNAPPITGWKVNGQLQAKPDGSPADGPVIPMSLPPGTHRISTVGTGADGRPFQTDADVLVAPKD